MDLGKIEKVSRDAADGSWHNAAGLPGVRVQVRPANCPAAARAFRRYARKEPDRTEDGGLTPEAEDALEKRVLAEVILIGWEGLEDGKEPIPYSPENAARLIDIAILREAVTQASERAAVDHVKSILAIEKN